MRNILIIISLIAIVTRVSAQNNSQLYNEKGQLIADTSYCVAIKDLPIITKIENQILKPILDSIVYPEIVVENYVNSKLIAIITIKPKNEILIKKFVCTDTITTIDHGSYKQLKYDLDPYVNKELKSLLENRIKLQSINLEANIEMHLPFEFLMTEDIEKKEFKNGRIVIQEIIELLELDKSAVESGGTISD
jgi:hypothetical protein